MGSVIKYIKTDFFCMCLVAGVCGEQSRFTKSDGRKKDV